MKMIVWFVFVLGALSAAGDVFIAKVGQKATLNCGVSSYTRSLVWRHGNNFLFFVDQRGFPRRGTDELVGRSVMRHVNLEICGVRETDAGKFTCSADGTRREHSLVVVSVSVTPSAVLQLGSEATLQCDVSGLVEGYEVRWRSPNACLPEGTSTTQLKPVTSLHNGTWQCVIPFGGQQLSESLTLKVKGTAMHDPMGISCWMWLAMGVCCLFGILLMLCVMVCVHVFCKGDRRRA